MMLSDIIQFLQAFQFERGDVPIGCDLTSIESVTGPYELYIRELRIPDPHGALRIWFERPRLDSKYSANLEIFSRG